MTQDEITEMARQVDACYIPRYDIWQLNSESLEAFAKLVTARTLMNIDPSSFMSYQEGFKAGVAKEREACADIAEKQRYAMNISLTSHPAQNGTAVGIANEIRARGES